MVQVTQTEEDIKIIIELNRLLNTRKPDIVLLPCYIKFNNPPIFFERHLTQEIDEMASFCRIFKNEARIVLVKKQKGIWPELFQTFSKEELMRKRLEIADQIVERNKERDKQAIERYENKRRAEIDKEIKRETAIRERVKKFEENACKEAFLDENLKEKQMLKGPEVPQEAERSQGGIHGGVVGTAVSQNSARMTTPKAPLRPAVQVRSAGKIGVNFSSFSYTTPKRESQEGMQRPFVIEDAS